MSLKYLSTLILLITVNGCQSLEDKHWQKRKEFLNKVLNSNWNEQIKSRPNEDVEYEILIEEIVFNIIRENAGVRIEGISKEDIAIPKDRIGRIIYEDHLIYGNLYVEINGESSLLHFNFTHAGFRQRRFNIWFYDHIILQKKLKGGALSKLWRYLEFSSPKGINTFKGTLYPQFIFEIDLKKQFSKEAQKELSVYQLKDDQLVIRIDRVNLAKWLRSIE